MGDKTGARAVCRAARLIAAVLRWMWLVLRAWLGPGRVEAAAPAWHRRPPPPCLAPHRRAKPAWARREVIRLKALMPGAGCRHIANTFNRRFAAHPQAGRRLTIGKTWVATLLRQHQHDALMMRRHLKHRVPPPAPNIRTWAMDLTGKTDATGRTLPVLGLIDHGSRALLALAALPNKSSWTLLGHLCLAIGRFGKPRSVRTDNESVFTSRLMRTALICLGIRHQRSDPGCPWQNGRIERLFLTLKTSLDQLEVAGLDALNGALGQFSIFYNHVRPHQHLQGRTPAEAWAGVTDGLKLPVKQEIWFEAWEGLLSGYCLRR